MTAATDYARLLEVVRHQGITVYHDPASSVCRERSEPATSDDPCYGCVLVELLGAQPAQGAPSAEGYEELGHAPLWWQGGDVADEEPGVRAAYAEEFARVPKPRTAIPSRAEILARGGSRG